MIKSLIVFQIIAFGLTSYGKSICDDATFRHSMQSSSNIIQLEDYKLEPSSPSRLVMFGEIHYYTSSALLVNLINKFAPQMQGKKCLFLEFSSAIDPHAMISKVENALANLPTGASQERADYTQMLNYFKPLVTAADKNSLKVFSIDHPKNFGQGMPLNVRDEAMTRRIVDLLGSNGSCDDAIMFVGKAHITADEPNREVLAKQLKQTSINVTTMNVVQASDPVPKEFESWSRLCEEPPFKPNERTYIFSNKLTSPDVEMWPNYKGKHVLSGKWQDFDFTVIAP